MYIEPLRSVWEDECELGNQSLPIEQKITLTTVITKKVVVTSVVVGSYLPVWNPLCGT